MSADEVIEWMKDCACKEKRIHILLEFQNGQTIRMYNIKQCGYRRFCSTDTNGTPNWNIFFHGDGNVTFCEAPGLQRSPSVSLANQFRWAMSQELEFSVPPEIPFT